MFRSPPAVLTVPPREPTLVDHLCDSDSKTDGKSVIPPLGAPGSTFNDTDLETLRASVEISEAQTSPTVLDVPALTPRFKKPSSTLSSDSFPALDADVTDILQEGLLVPLEHEHFFPATPTNTASSAPRPSPNTSAIVSSSSDLPDADVDPDAALMELHGVDQSIMRAPPLSAGAGGASPHSSSDGATPRTMRYNSSLPIPITLTPQPTESGLLPAPVHGVSSFDNDKLRSSNSLDAGKSLVWQGPSPPLPYRSDACNCVYDRLLRPIPAQDHVCEY